ncbi:hypothetical protein OS175_11235 [Marinicella sp. S1101]|uniref:CAF17-like 4Fe-4S cluster assembly/insertion protein YgfZ n=1 Tax=Marinicella marina TaxID=2996016 RepID=UPI002260F86D|nr:hypothetical protein [Marinicella marina]MCX7554457.1 hypothetical protein [Marinicella marina]MDJ1140608.1 hypothetical protein [Marinicella marina]
MSENNNNHIDVLELSGKDVMAFLNNQVVSELNDKNEAVVYTAICNPKGRIIFSFFLKNTEKTTYVAINSDLSDTFLQYVQMRKFRMDVNINQSTAQLVLTQNLTNDYGVDIIEAETSTQITPNHDQFWLHMFDVGLPWITKETSEMFIPQHLNLDQIGVIDFNKGCYPGQEIVARLHFLGKVKKRMIAVSHKNPSDVVNGQMADLTGFAKKVEVCAPSIRLGDDWLTQVIAPAN